VILRRGDLLRSEMGREFGRTSCTVTTMISAFFVGSISLGLAKPMKSALMYGIVHCTKDFSPKSVGWAHIILVILPDILHPERAPS
jgi:hypothetical protein